MVKSDESNVRNAAMLVDAKGTHAKRITDVTQIKKSMYMFIRRKST